MPSWAIVGATRGIGFEYVNQLSADSQNTVFALIRSQKTAGPLNQLASSRKNIHVIETDISNTGILKTTAQKVGEITGGKLDVLIYNAYSVGTEANMLTPSAFTGKEAELEQEVFESIKVNLLHVVYTINTFLPLIRNSEQKKIIYVSSGIGDVQITRVSELPNLLGYAVGKASGNIVIAKYAVELKSEGILTLSMSPGWVGTDAAKEVANSPEAFQFMLASMQKLKPGITGWISPEESVKDQLAVINSFEASKSGAFVSHHGNNEDWV
ncbi:hypothetical protein F5884DRAFT_807690 [Xylogone sp. PMI_703]|nr:hypothetical protein F5884DRAFT_807690 [Xylogone sp. PMI_703]